METVETHTIARPKSSYWWGGVANCLPAQFLICSSIFASRCVFCKVEVISFSKHPTFWKSVSKINFYIDFPKKIFFRKFLKSWNFEKFPTFFREKSKMFESWVFKKKSTFSIFSRKNFKNFRNFQFFKNFRKYFFSGKST